jgi:hypothetical protein
MLFIKNLNKIGYSKNLLKKIIIIKKYLQLHFKEDLDLN